MIYRDLLAELLAIPSISTDPAYAKDMLRAADYLEGMFSLHGFAVQQVTGYGNPLILARYEKDPSLQTCLIYGHYDVQPAKHSEGWDSDPFQLTERNGRLYGRGVIDNKGQFMVHAATAFELIKEGNLGYNLLFLIEGDEETGSGNLRGLIQDRPELLKADFALISDGEVTAGHPVIEIGFRGVFNCTLTATTSHTDLHSGLYGGLVPNAAHTLARLIAGFYDENNRIAIPGFYEGSPMPDEKTQAANRLLPFDGAEFSRLTGAEEPLTEPGLDPYTQVGLRPSIQVTTLTSGYQGDGYRNSVPAQATAKINARLYPGQDPEKAEAALLAYAQAAPHGKVGMSEIESHAGCFLDTENEFAKKARRALRESFGLEPLLKYCGAIIPLVGDFQELLNLPQVLAPLANEDCAMHAANENFELGQLEKAQRFSRLFLEKN